MIRRSQEGLKAMDFQAMLKEHRSKSKSSNQAVNGVEATKTIWNAKIESAVNYSKKRVEEISLELKELLLHTHK